MNMPLGATLTHSKQTAAANQQTSKPAIPNAHIVDMQDIAVLVVMSQFNCLATLRLEFHKKQVPKARPSTLLIISVFPLAHQLLTP
jgi:hypothetical protein